MNTQGQGNQAHGRRLRQRSGVWDHFTRHTGDDGREKANCNRCGKVYAYHGTKNLWEHYNEGCDRQESADAGTSEQPPQPLPSLAQDDEAMQQLPVPLPACAPSRHGGSSDREPSGLQEEASKHLARMIALRGYDASFLEDYYFKGFVNCINPEFKVPSRVAIENMCDGIFDEARKDLLDRLRCAPGKVSVAVGRTKTMEGKVSVAVGGTKTIDEEVLYVACHFIDDEWNLHKPVLHAILTTAHLDQDDGPILGVDVCYKLSEGVIQVITDHDIGDRLFMVVYRNIHPQLTNLFCGKQFSKGMLYPTYMDNVLHSIAQCFLPGGDLSLILCNQMKDSDMTRQGRMELIAELGLHYEWAYDQHWYACYCSLELLFKKGLFPGQLQPSELVIINLLRKLWEKIYRAIQKISSSTHPTGNICLVELFKLWKILQSELSKRHGDVRGLFHDDKDVTYVLTKASDTLKNAIEDSDVASLLLALDPRFKLKFIESNSKRVFGKVHASRRIEYLKGMIKGLYDGYVEQYGTTHGADHSDGASSAMDITTSADNPMGQAWNGSRQGMTELDRYLEDPCDSQAEGFHILNWWKTHSSKYPIVAQMARDALAMPTCSKLSSDQMAQVRSILRGYSKKPYGAKPFPR